MEKLEVFDLSTETWFDFVAQFTPIYENNEINSEEKFTSLMKCLEPGSKAKKMVENCPKKNVKEAFENLKYNFGRQDMLIEVYTRKLLALIVPLEKPPLGDLHGQLKNYLKALKTLGIKDHCDFMLYPMVEGCLPYHLQQDWGKLRINMLGPANPLEDLMDFIEAQVQSQTSFNGMDKSVNSSNVTYVADINCVKEEWVDLEDLTDHHPSSPQDTEEHQENFGESSQEVPKFETILKSETCNKTPPKKVKSKKNTSKCRYFCDKCNRGYIKKPNLDKHKVSCGLKRFSCSLCEKSFTRKSGFKSHILWHEKSSEENIFHEKPSFSCNICEKTFGRKSNMKKHVLSHAKEFGREFFIEDSESKTFSCKLCNITFKDKGDWMQHKRTHSGPIAGGKFWCAECGKKVADRRSLKAHFAMHSGDRRFSCTLCDKSYVRKSHLQTHQKIHGDLICIECGEAQTSQEELDYHLATHSKSVIKQHIKQPKRFKNILKKDKSCLCFVCGKTLRDAACLGYHITAFHSSQEKTLSCEICGKTFLQKAHLRYHMSVFHKDGRYPCSTCGKMLASKQSLAYHMTKHTGERTFPCKICNKSYPEIRTLNRHMKTHTGEAKITCTECGRILAHKHALKTHLTTVHGVLEIGDSRKITFSMQNMFDKSSTFEEMLKN